MSILGGLGACPLEIFEKFVTLAHSVDFKKHRFKIFKVL